MASIIKGMESDEVSVEECPEKFLTGRKSLEDLRRGERGVEEEP